MTEDVLLNKAAIIERCLARIHEDYDADRAALHTDFTRQDAIILNLQRACESAIDLAMHVTRKQRLGLPQDARDAFTLLERAGVIDNDTATQMRAMVGFRNVAVHQYQQLSLPILQSILDGHLDDFTRFTQALLKPCC